jgi:ABC-type dipeptide/oligopeptide/nickel transport system ATPase component
MKECNFEEVIANIKVGETYECTDKYFVINKITKSEIGLDFNQNNVMYNGIKNTQRFIKVETPVKFMEAVADKSNMIKVDVSNIGYINQEIKEKLNEYNTIGATIYNLSNVLTNEDLSILFQEGNWFIQ